MTNRKTFLGRNRSLIAGGVLFVAAGLVLAGCDRREHAIHYYGYDDGSPVYAYPYCYNRPFVVVPEHRFPRFEHRWAGPRGDFRHGEGGHRR